MVMELAVVMTSSGGGVVMLGVAAVGGEPWKLNIAMEAIYSRNNLRIMDTQMSLPYLCTKNETMAPLHVATLTVQRELPKYEIIFSI